MKPLFFLWISLFTSSLLAQERIIVEIPTAKTEAEYVWRTLQDIAFFEQHNYQISLPQGELIETLKQKSTSGELTEEDYLLLEQFMVKEVYRKSDYEKGHQAIQEQLALLDQMVNAIPHTSYPWGYHSFERYTVHLTLYGPGGSFNPDEGSLLVFTTPEGGFKNYRNPANTIIHEIVHIGIEESIIAKYNVPHAMKERIVDTFVAVHFQNLLPEYHIQEMGENRTDTHLKTKEDFIRLDRIVAAILQ